MSDIRLARSPWTDLVVVCRKCARKAGARTFSKQLKSALKEAGAGKRVRVVEAGCLDLCPKRRIALAVSHESARGRLLVASPDIAH